MKGHLYIFGAGSFFRCIRHLVKDTCTRQNLTYRLVDSDATGQKNLRGELIISESGFESEVKPGFFFNVAIANVHIRRKIAQRCLALGGIPLNLLSNDLLSYDNVSIGDGAIIADRTMVTTSITIGKFFHCNIYSYVEHDCIIGDYVTFSPRVSCNGHVSIADDVFVGAGAVIRNGISSRLLTIGKGAVIGMGAVVTQDVPAFATVVGNPARVIKSGSI